ncbi:MAG: HAMP domain-containing sensor histidine kinase [Parcubacteria group bacterium]|jgi:signal transduction histidine kinase
MPKQINSQLVRRLKYFSRILGGMVFLIGFLALAGWQFDLIFFKRIVSSLPIIASNTAFSFFLGGIVLFLIADQQAGEKKYLTIISRIFSSLIAFVGLFTLFEYLFGINLGIDRLLFAGVQGESAVRMSPQSAFNFLMTGVSLLFIAGQEKEKVKVSQVIILLAGAVSLVSLFGFIYNISSFYTISPFKGMAAHTAVAFVVMFFGILLANSEIGFMRIFVIRGLSGLAARRLFFVLVFVIVAEVLATIGRRINAYDYSFELLIHLFVIVGSFVYLIFFAFRSLDELGKMETSLAKSQELDQAKTEFVGLASHQLRTPLTAVSWFTEMLLKKDFGNLNEKQEDYLSEIYAGNQKMIDLVDDLLNTSRIDMGTIKVKPELINLVEIMESILSEFLPQISQKNISIEKKFSRNLPLVKIDPEHLEIVFQNILSNAVKYTPPKGKIAIEMRRQNSHILVKIADNGWGIPAAQQKKIFTKLFRADNVRKKDTEGTGLGLYIARSIIKKSGGKIWFESKENKGTTFYITLKASR